MKVKVAKWGNSLGVRLPKQYADELGLKAGSTVDLARDGSRLAIEAVPVPPRNIPYYRLEDLLAQIKPATKPPPFEDWSAVEPPWPDDDWSDIAPTDEEWAAEKASSRRTAKKLAPKERKRERPDARRARRKRA